MEDQDLNLRQAGWFIDLGTGHRIDADYDSPERFWVAIGSGIPQVSAWMKGVEGIDIRVSIERSADGLTVSFDRGDLPEAWWSAETAPRMHLNIDRNRREVIVTAMAEPGTEVILGRTSLPESS